MTLRRALLCAGSCSDRVGSDHVRCGMMVSSAPSVKANASLTPQRSRAVRLPKKRGLILYGSCLRPILIPHSETARTSLHYQPLVTTPFQVLLGRRSPGRSPAVPTSGSDDIGRLAFLNVYGQKKHLLRMRPLNKDHPLRRRPIPTYFLFPSFRLNTHGTLQRILQKPVRALHILFIYPSSAC